MKALLGTVLSIAILGTSQMALANDCKSLTRDLYTAQGYQQRCGYQLKQTPILAQKIKEQSCAETLQGADKNQLLNQVNGQLNQVFANPNAKKDSCEQGKRQFN